MRSISIDLGTLDAALKPNARVHWRAPLSHKAGAREAAMMLARSAMNEAGYEGPFEKARLEITSYWCGHRPDEDNFVAQMKYYVDGLIGEAIVDDNHAHLIRSWPTFVRVPHRDEARVVVTVAEVADDGTVERVLA